MGVGEGFVLVSMGESVLHSLYSHTHPHSLSSTHKLHLIGFIYCHLYEDNKIIEVWVRIRSVIKLGKVPFIKANV